MLRLLRRAFINPFNIILLVLGIISLATDVVLVSNFARNATTAVIIFSMILISGTIHLIQELRAKKPSSGLGRTFRMSVGYARSLVVARLAICSAEKKPSVGSIDMR